MDRAFDMIKNNPEVFAALVAAIAIVGGVFGNWISAKVQASGGRAQANAAVDAARISTEAQRMSALREDRRVQIAAFIRHAREILKECDLMFLEEGHEPSARSAYEELVQLEGQLELVSPESVLAPAERVMDAVGDSLQLGLLRAPAARARRTLSRLRAGDSGHEAAHEAWNRLEELKAAYVGDDDDAQRQACRTAASSALDNVPALTAQQRKTLVFDAALPPLADAQFEIGAQRNSAVRDLVTEARSVLGADAA
ncbi:hypothetical protein [Streptomyces sp. NPDC023588]|uniref:hypothetical protein n=1 Tax=Streptomyces sp. NPDC023588 TaxID=3154907 RepID=UPI0033FD80D4